MNTIGKWSRSVMSDSLRPHGLQPTRLLCPWDFPGNCTGADCHFLLQWIFPTQGPNPGLLHSRQTLNLWGTREVYISEYKLAFLEMAWDLGYLAHLCFHLHLIKPTKAEWTLREKQSWTTWGSGSAVLTGRWRHTDPPSPSGIWQVRLFSPQLGRRQNGNLSVIEWKYQKYIGYRELYRQNEK